MSPGLEAQRSIVALRDYKEKFDLDAVLAEAVSVAVRAGATNPYEAIAGFLRDVKIPEKAAGDANGDAMNDAMHAMGVLKHDPPTFAHFDPAEAEQKPVIIKEVKLPHATETHEVCYEPVSRCVFVSQMSNSVLVRIPVSSTNGLLVDDQDAWLVGAANAAGDGVEGLHNLSLSYRHPGCLWVSLQFSNTLLLLEGATMRVREVIRVPTLLEVPGEAPRRVGGPHAIRECPKSGDIWVALKGAVSCHPTAPRPGDAANAGARRLRDAVERACCSAASLASYMEACDAMGYDCPPPDDFAVWRLAPGAYRADEKDRGGTLYRCRGSPPMVAIDWQGNCWCPQDQNPSIMRVDAATGACAQIPVTFPEGASLKITGPAIGVAPDGDVWCCFGARTFSLMGVIIVAASQQGLFASAGRACLSAARDLGVRRQSLPHSAAGPRPRSAARTIGCPAHIVEWYDVMGFLLEKFSFNSVISEPACLPHIALSGCRRRRRASSGCARSRRRWTTASHPRKLPARR